MSGLPLDDISELLKTPEPTTRRGRTKRDPTEPREYATWWKLLQRISEDQCSNPNCLDPRERNDRGRSILAEVKGEMICRYCFLDGYLSDAK